MLLHGVLSQQALFPNLPLAICMWHWSFIRRTLQVGASAKRRLREEACEGMGRQRRGCLFYFYSCAANSAQVRAAPWCISFR